MLDWLAQNLGTIVVLLVLIAVVALIIRYLVGQKKRGKTSCGCNCAGCAMRNACHGKQ
jgi:hypothetical protein